MTSPASSPAANPSDLLLCLNGAEERVQLVLADIERPDRPLAVQEWVAPGRTMQLLAPALERMLAHAGAAPAAVRRIACVRGPGSFTGLRVVLATAMGLATAVEAETAGVDYLHLLALAPARRLLATPGEGAALWVATHARRNQVHLQGFRVAKDGPVALCDPFAPSTAEAVQAILAGPLPAAALGSGLRRNPVTLAEPLETAGVALLPPIDDHPHPDILLEVCAGARFGTAPVEPFYLRPSDAEENLDAIATKRGVDPEEARRRLEALRS